MKAESDPFRSSDPAAAATSSAGASKPLGMNTEHLCCQRVYAGSFSGYPCRKPAKVEHDGRHYCGTHDPVRVKVKAAERQAARDAKFNAEQTARQLQRETRDAQEKNAARYLWLRANQIDLGDCFMFSIDDAIEAAIDAGLHAKPEDQAVIDGMTITPPLVTASAGPVDSLGMKLEWISVEERLPEFAVPVWLRENDRAYIGGREYDGDGWLWGRCYSSPYWVEKARAWSADIEWDDEYKPTHWMPLPLPLSVTPSKGGA